MENEKGHKNYSFTLPIPLAEAFERELEKSHFGTSEYIRKLIREELSKEK